MRPYHLALIFAVWCASVVVAATGGMQHAQDMLTLPHIVTATR